MKLSGIHFRLDLIVSWQVENRKQTLGACPNLSGISEGRQCTYDNVEARTCNHCCSREAIRITYSADVFVALGIQPAMRMRHIVFCCLSGFTVYFHIILKRHDFRKKSY